MLILMTNPKHGSMYVYSENEAVRHEQLGWMRKPETQPFAELKVKPEPEPRRKYTRKAK